VQSADVEDLAGAFGVGGRIILLRAKALRRTVPSYDYFEQSPDDS
jgi:hypothetical protein